MRRSIYRGSNASAVNLFGQAAFVHVGGAAADGTPIVRALHGVVVDNRLCFHAAAAGEKMELLGRQVVAVTQRVIAEIPSHFVDPSLACPATTYYQSAQVCGELVRIEDVGTKARVLEALMQRFQPEGGYDPIDPGDRRYAPVLRGLLVAGVDLESAVAKIKVGQNRRPNQILPVLEGLWKRGADGDIEAIEMIREARPDLPTPPFLSAPEEVVLSCCPGPERLEEAVALLRPTYWNESVPTQNIADAQLGSAAWVGALDSEGRLIASARAVSDGASYCYIADVVVDPQWRSRGVGKAVVRLLLDHPRVRNVRRVQLATMDAQAFYRPFGFENLPPRPPPFSQMQLHRA